MDRGKLFDDLYVRINDSHLLFLRVGTCSLCIERLILETRSMSSTRYFSFPFLRITLLISLKSFSLLSVRFPSK